MHTWQLFALLAVCSGAMPLMAMHIAMSADVESLSEAAMVALRTVVIASLVFGIAVAFVVLHKGVAMLDSEMRRRARQDARRR